MEQFLVHPDRPRSIRERQEEIKERVRAASRLGFEAEKDENEAVPEKGTAVRAGVKAEKKRKDGWRGCWCFNAS